MLLGSVEPLLEEPSKLSWLEGVEFAAEPAKREFENVEAGFGFIAKGRKPFGPSFQEFEACGGDLPQAMCFI